MTSTTPDPDPTNNDGTANVVVDGKATDLEVIKTVDVSDPFEGDTVVFTITVNNNGPENDDNIQITDAIPAGLTLVSVVPTEGTYTAPIWDLGKLDKNNTESMVVTATVDPGTAGTDLVNVATVTSA